MTQDELINEILSYFQSQRGIANSNGISLFGATKDLFDEATKNCIDRKLIIRISDNHLDYQYFKITPEGKLILNQKF